MYLVLNSTCIIVSPLTLLTFPSPWGLRRSSRCSCGSLAHRLSPALNRDLSLPLWPRALAAGSSPPTRKIVLGHPVTLPRKQIALCHCLAWSGDWEKLRELGKRAIWSSEETIRVSLYCILWAQICTMETGISNNCLWKIAVGYSARWFHHGFKLRHTI